MAHTEHHAAHGAHAGHETTDAHLGGAERFMVVVAVLLAGCFFTGWLMYRYLASVQEAADVPPSPVVARDGDRLPPVPRLQTTPTVDLTAFRTAQSATVDSWAWVDRAEGIARIPVARAIEILAERGLPVPPPVPGAPAAAPPAGEPGAAVAATAAGN